MQSEKENSKFCFTFTVPYRCMAEVYAKDIDTAIANLKGGLVDWSIESHGPVDDSSIKLEYMIKGDLDHDD